MTMLGLGRRLTTALQPEKLSWLLTTAHKTPGRADYFIGPNLQFLKIAGVLLQRNESGHYLYGDPFTIRI